MTINEKLQALRSKMQVEGIDAYICTKFDPHQSEYVSPYYNAVVYISGFTGSNGTVVVTQEKAILWTDGRYYIQAERELSGSDFELYKMEAGVKDLLTFVRDEVKPGGTVGFDGRTLSFVRLKELKKIILPKEIKFKDGDLLGSLWTDRPPLSSNALYVHEERFCGQSRLDKISRVAALMQEKEADIYLISSLDDIAWLLNLRGNDMPNCTTFLSYAAVSLENGKATATLFVASEKVAPIQKELEKEINIEPYEAFSDFVQSATGKIALVPGRTNAYIYGLLENKALIELETDFTTNLKAIKNETELENVRLSNIRDGVSMVRFIHWIKSRSKQELESITEIDIEKKLANLRAQNENFLFPSFDTIAGYQENAAMAHYKATEDNCKTLDKEGFLLVDSGGNYLDGTTDITRTIALGPLTAQMKKDFTLVLKGHIALSQAIFLYGTTGTNLDILARSAMWKEGIDFKHGTGHGLGFCLNVHEGPQGIGMGASRVKLEVGMLLTNEPGIYRAEEYGIRTENTLVVREHKTTGFGRFLCFETVSLCPIDQEAIDASLLSTDELNWLNDYHKEVYEKLSPYLDEEEKAWLHAASKEI